MPSKTNNFNVESLKGQSHIRDMRRTCNAVVESMGDRLFDATSRGKNITFEELLTQEDLIMLKRRIFALKQRPTLPPIVTHNMVDDLNDPILNHLRRIKMFNAPQDRVKIIYHPEFLNSTNPLIPLDYTDFVRACHLGIFVSYYEPWGYTPSECTVLGVPSVTSNLTGFANYMRRGLSDPDSKGIYIVDRRFKSPEESVDQLTQYLFNFCQLDRRQRIELRNRTEKLSELLDWRTLGKYYVQARSMAFDRAFPSLSTTIDTTSTTTTTTTTSTISPTTTLLSTTPSLSNMRPSSPLNIPTITTTQPAVVVQPTAVVQPVVTQSQPIAISTTASAPKSTTKPEPEKEKEKIVVGSSPKQIPSNPTPSSTPTKSVTINNNNNSNNNNNNSSNNVPIKPTVVTSSFSTPSSTTTSVTESASPDITAKKPTTTSAAPPAAANTTTTTKPSTSLLTASLLSLGNKQPVQDQSTTTKPPVYPATTVVQPTVVPTILKKEEPQVTPSSPIKSSPAKPIIKK
ncbi:glycogen synthase [Cavenderia fasciculata]|uniref:Glycogen [starch] synthase n=1 Tax=Cavenderia fasciculata TaxID=261658 RepID=F4PT62_CACFS|nr:glycogen synthase [Cavenderia fasciculata]EGG20798.1 glycogen synthase [Cavenderia fasciculata]|eukprot:XP_004358648.1 glycogen synthase [Cavenderia fasciculata]